MRTTPLQPLGVEVSDVSLGAITDDDISTLRRLLAEHGVLVVPGQDALDDDGFVAFLSRFGELTFTTGETPVPETPALNVISNVGRTTPPKSSFHVDTSYVRVPPVYTALRAVQIPSRGGETLFSDQYRAYDTLDAGLREALGTSTVRHVATGVELGPDDESEAEHPLFRQHPISGRTSVYLSTPQRCRSISGLSEQDATRTVAQLLEHSTRPDNILRHAWSPGDVVMWDNGCVLHRADHADVTGDRVMHRGMVAGPYVVEPSTR
ncbi:TauD/TfdA dioxygenase family protein [uncultured Jatrophihabitans sp.]|uniref:TauD/TfdA dioxygenase family protein n=1 Tax=uncultured Jatrophihabitans sp. TaxID=1610747 RepID=UPI0035CAF3B6